MNEKPPVLGAWEALKRVQDGAILYKAKEEVPVKKLLEAQRDADVEWYEDKIIGIRKVTAIKIVAECAHKIEQAKTEVAREIFGVGDKMIEILQHSDFSSGNEAFGMDEGRVRAHEMMKDIEEQWQSLKDRHLK